MVVHSVQSSFWGLKQTPIPKGAKDKIGCKGHNNQKKCSVRLRYDVLGLVREPFLRRSYGQILEIFLGFRAVKVLAFYSANHEHQMQEPWAAPSQLVSKLLAEVKA